MMVQSNNCGQLNLTNGEANVGEIEGAFQCGRFLQCKKCMMKYSWDNNTRRDEIKVLTKLDRFYSPKIKGDY